MKLGIKIVSLTLAVLMPLIILFSVAFIAKSEYDESFVASLDDKLERLYSIDEKKVVIIGCSSAAFGYDSSIIEKYLGMPVVNMGIYAALGTKVMLDLSKDAIGEGDIVIVAPEMDRQTMSLYFSAGTTLRALDGSHEYLLNIPKENRASLLGASFGFASEKLSYKVFGSPEFEGMYNSKSFNELGDIGVHRAENVMFDYYDPNVRIRVNEDIVSPDFIEYINDYSRYCSSVGANLYFEFCPMNRLGFDDDSNTAEARREFFEFLDGALDFPIIASDIEDYVYDEGYFYDSNLHLNSAGVVKHTVNVTRDLLLELGIAKAVTEEIPDVPSLPERDVRFFGEDENAQFFKYEKMSNGAYVIVGVKEEYLSERTLTVPLGYEGYKVVAIGKGALRGSSAETLIVTDDTNVRIFENGAFSGAGSLKQLYMYYPECADINPPDDFTGTADGFRVHIPAKSGYETDAYGWGDLGLRFEYIYD